MSNELPYAAKKCPECGTQMRITLKKGRLPSKPVPCPKCQTPIELSEADVTNPGEAPASQSGGFGIIRKRGERKKPRPEQRDPVMFGDGVHVERVGGRRGRDEVFGAGGAPAPSGGVAIGRIQVKKVAANLVVDQNDPDLPAPAPVADADANLPAPVADAHADLPAPVAEANADLPAPKVDADLPAPKADLPAPVSADPAGESVEVMIIDDDLDFDFENEVIAAGDEKYGDPVTQDISLDGGIWEDGEESSDDAGVIDDDDSDLFGGVVQHEPEPNEPKKPEPFIPVDAEKPAAPRERKLSFAGIAPKPQDPATQDPSDDDEERDDSKMSRIPKPKLDRLRKLKRKLDEIEDEQEESEPTEEHQAEDQALGLDVDSVVEDVDVDVSDIAADADIDADIDLDALDFDGDDIEISEASEIELPAPGEPDVETEDTQASGPIVILGPDSGERPPSLDELENPADEIAAKSENEALVQSSDADEIATKPEDEVTDATKSEKSSGPPVALIGGIVFVLVIVALVAFDLLPF